MWSGYSEQGRGGQERGPGAFSARQPGVPAAYVAGQEGSAVQAGVRGGGVAPTGNVVIPERQDKTLQTLLNLGQEHLGKEIKRLEEQAFLDGWAKAASGVALDELQAEQPAFSRIFGDSATVEGARAYQTQATVDRWVLATQQKMDELRKLPPSAVPKQLYGEIEGLLTGDPATDAMLRGQLFKAAVPLLKQHTKEHVGWQQEEARTARGNAFRASADKLEAFVAANNKQPGTHTEQEINLLKQGLMETIVPNDGANLPTWEKDVVEFMAEAAGHGKFAVVQVLRETGALDKLKPDDLQRVDSAIRRAASPTLLKVSPEYVTRLLDLQSNPDLTDDEVMQELARINAEASAASGVPLEYGQLVPLGQYDSYVASARNAKSAAERAALRQRAAEVKAHEEALTAARLTNAGGTGILDRYASYYDEEGNPTGGGSFDLEVIAAKPAEVDAAATAKFMSMPPEERGRFLSAFPKQKFDAVEAALASWWTQSEGEKAVMNAGYAQLAALWATSTERVRGAYFTSEQNAELKDFVAATQGAGIPAESAFLLRKETVRQAKGRTRPPQRAALVEAIKDYSRDPSSRWFRGDLPDMDTGIVANIVGGVAQARPEYGVDDKVAAQRAYAWARSQGMFTIVGDRAIVNTDPEGARSGRTLEAIVGYPPVATARAFNELIRERITASGGNDEERLVLRLPDQNGKARYMVESTNQQGRTVFAQLTSDDVLARGAATSKGSGTGRKAAAERQDEAAARQREAGQPSVFQSNR